MKTLLCMIALCSAIWGHTLQWFELDETQKRNARLIYRLVDDLDKRLALIAIAWQESKLGEAPINLQDPSCGVFHMLAPVYLRQNNIADNSYNRNLYCGKLINDIVLSIRTAEKQLDYWLKVHKNDLRLAIQSYNAGYNVGAGAKYYEAVAKTMAIVRSYAESGVLK